MFGFRHLSMPAVLDVRYSVAAPQSAHSDDVYIIYVFIALQTALWCSVVHVHTCYGFGCSTYRLRFQ